MYSSLKYFDLAENKTTDINTTQLRIQYDFQMTLLHCVLDKMKQ